MKKSKYIFSIVCFVAWFLSIFVLFFNKPASSQKMVCSERTLALQSLKKNFNEELTERGVTEQGLVVSLAVAPNGKWTMLMTTNDNPYSHCIVASGKGWEQGSTASTGIAYSGNLVSIGFDDNGDWSMVVIQAVTNTIIPTIRGHAWERVINLNIQKQSL